VPALLSPARFTRRLGQKRAGRPRRERGAARGSEEKVALVGFPFRPAMPSEAHFLGIIGAKFIAKELTV
jgi:hypothetical protein